LTDEEAYPHEVDQDQITSVERIVDGVVISLMKSDCLKYFFVLTSASIDFKPFGENEQRPTQIEERILGAFILPQKNPVVIDTNFDIRSNSFKVKVLSLEHVPEGRSFIPPSEKPIKIEILVTPLKREIKIRTKLVEKIDPRGV